MAADARNWAFSDAWILTSVALHGSEGCDLSGLIGAADACNHAILTSDELAQGVGRLVASGLVALDGARFSLTPAGQTLVSKRKGGMFAQVSSVEQSLSKQPLTEGRWEVAPEDVDAACRVYTRGMRTR